MAWLLVFLLAGACFGGTWRLAGTYRFDIPMGLSRTMSLKVNGGTYYKFRLAVEPVYGDPFIYRLVPISLALHDPFKATGTTCLKYVAGIGEVTFTYTAARTGYYNVVGASGTGCLATLYVYEYCWSCR